MGKKRSMFYNPARHKKLSEVVSLESPSKAKKAGRTLLGMFRHARSREKKREIKQATVLAANRARASSKRKHLSRKERRQYEEMAEIYESVYKEMEL